MRYQKVDRSDFTPNFDGHMGDEPFDIGWAEGTLQDGRPYRMECWGLAGSTGVTVFLPSEGIEAYDPAQVNALLEMSRVITTLEPQDLSLYAFVDPSGIPCVSISYVVANDTDDYFVEAHPPLHRYDVAESATHAQAPDILLSTGDLMAESLLDQDTLTMLDAMLSEMTAPLPRSAMAEARRVAKAQARTQPKKRRAKRRKFRKN